MGIVKGIGHILLIVTLTIVTQIGGLIYLITLGIAKRRGNTRVMAIVIFLVLYFTSTFLLVPILASLFGRVALPLTGDLRPLNFMTVVLNRHYADPALRSELSKAAEEMAEFFPGSKTNYLDANFPFLDNFPLLPHLSHDDGNKVDLAFFYYEIPSGRQLDDAPSFIGYGVYDDPKSGETNFPAYCAQQGFWQYGAMHYLIPQHNKERYVVEELRTVTLLHILHDSEKTSKIFIEPHLKTRWGLQDLEKIRFHGCQAVRHDDHIHWEIN